MLHFEWPAAQVLDTLSQRLDSHIEQQLAKDSDSSEQPITNDKLERTANPTYLEPSDPSLDDSLIDSAGGRPHTPEDGADKLAGSDAVITVGDESPEPAPRDSLQGSTEDGGIVREDQPFSSETSMAAADGLEKLAQDVSHVSESYMHQQVQTADQYSLAHASQ